MRKGVLPLSIPHLLLRPKKALRKRSCRSTERRPQEISRQYWKREGRHQKKLARSEGNFFFLCHTVLTILDTFLHCPKSGSFGVNLMCCQLVGWLQPQLESVSQVCLFLSFIPTPPPLLPTSFQRQHLPGNCSYSSSPPFSPRIKHVVSENLQKEELGRWL